ncbi:MAG TPA: MFS transporter [Ktedonobacterales bacterium]|nr:MFS transporter [Ktedonobacterales bacterium]
MKHVTRESNTQPFLPPSRRPRLATPAVVLVLLFGINALNYLDRLLAVAVGPTLKSEFHLTDAAIGVLTSAFLIIYTLAALPAGLLADHFSRARVVAAGVGLWSLMSAATAFVRGFSGLVLTRAAVGIGEASYFPAGTALLSNYYPLKTRARAMSRWGTGQIFGAMLAFVLAALFFHLFGETLGWRVAFLVAGIPGLALAVIMWRVPDAPTHPATSFPHPNAPQSPARMPTPAVRTRAITPADHLAHIVAVVRIPTVRLSIVLQALTYIAVTPTATFIPIYLRSRHGPFHLGATQADLLAGALLVVGGLAGVLLGGYLADWLSARTRGGRILAIGAGFACGLPCYVTMLLCHSIVLFAVAGLFAILALNIQVGPLGAVVQDATPPALRATAVAVVLLLAHLLGDAWASTAAGALSTAMGERTALALLFIGAPALLVAVVVSAFGARVYARDVARRAHEAAASSAT